MTTDAAGRDRSTYTLRLGDEVRRGLNKRRAIHAVVGYLIRTGVSPASISAAMVDRGARTFFSVLRKLEAAAYLVAATKLAQATGRTFDPGRWLCAPGELFHAEGATFALSNQWGSRTFSATIASLARAHGSGRLSMEIGP